MATQDAVDQFVSNLQALASPAASAAQIQSLQQQIASLQAQINTLQAQIVQLQGGDGQQAQLVLNIIKQVLPNRTGVTVTATAV